MLESDATALLRWGFGDEQRQARAARAQAGLPGGTPGRVSSQHKGGLFVATALGEKHAVVPGKLRRAARTGEAELPAVGDWVILSEQRDQGAVQVVGLLPRKSVLARKAAGEREERQILAANVDRVFLLMALADPLNLRRMERALAVVRESGAAPVVVLSKADLCEDPQAQLAKARAVAPGAPLIVVSARTGLGLPELEALLTSGSTAVMLGASGVGKSTLVNRWLGSDAQQQTAEVDALGKGRHATTHRELLPLPWGALVIDTPGLRELGRWEGSEGLREVFEDVEALAPGCKFNDCGHQTEPGCAVRAAVESGALPGDRLESFLKLRAEIAAREKKVDARARAEGKAKIREVARSMNALKRKPR